MGRGNASGCEVAPYVRSVEIPPQGFLTNQLTACHKPLSRFATELYVTLGEVPLGCVRCVDKIGRVVHVFYKTKPQATIATCSGGAVCLPFRRRQPVAERLPLQDRCACSGAAPAVIAVGVSRPPYACRLVREVAADWRSHQKSKANGRGLRGQASDKTANDAFGTCCSEEKEGGGARRSKNRPQRFFCELYCNPSAANQCEDVHLSYPPHPS